LAAAGLELDRAKSGGLGHCDGAVDMHRVAPAAGAVEDQRQRAHGPDIEPGLRHLGEREVASVPHLM